MVSWCWFNSHWLVPAIARPLSLGSQCSCFLLLKFLPVQNWTFKAEFHQITGQLPALQDRKRERIWLRRGDKACREGRVEYNRRAAFDLQDKHDFLVRCLQIMLQFCGIPCPHAGTLTFPVWLLQFTCVSASAGILSYMSPRLKNHQR